MALLSLSNVKKAFGTDELFSNVSFTIENGHRIGLVGINGCGKTTLFKIIQDKIDYDDGEIYKSKNTVVGFVEQFICSDEGQTVYDETLHAYDELIELENKIQKLQLEIENDGINIESKLNLKNSLEEKYLNNGGYTYKSITNSTLKGLGFKDDELNLKISKLSGGQKTKIMLAKMLLSKANLLLLDEPTNNLDIDAIEWLENFLLNYKGSYIIISHDRYFLDKVTEETFELENKKLSIYKGNYSKYIELKTEKNKTLNRKYESTQKEIQRIEGIIEQQKTWSQERNYKIIKSKQKIIDRLQDGMIEPDTELEKMNFHFETVAGGNQDVLIIKNLAKKFADKFLFKNVNIEVHKKERVFIIGPNGCGKTTLLKIIQSKLQQDEGTLAIGSNMKIAYYSQMQEDFIENKSILDFVWEKHLELNQTEVRKALATFLFRGEDVNKNILELSGGEKARLALLLVMLSKSNFLILDEVIYSIIRELNPQKQYRYYEDYDKSKFLSEVYFNENDYDELRALILKRKNVILQGSPGVGKTYIAKKMVYSILGNKDDEKILSVQFHELYSNDEFMEGYRPDDIGIYKYKRGCFKRICNKARNDPSNKYFVIIDEINRGNIAKIFGEAFSLIEVDKRGKENYIELACSRERFYVPNNVYIIGTMNTYSDELALKDFALRRRFCFYTIYPAFENDNFKKFYLQNPLLSKVIDGIVDVNSNLCDDLKIGHSYFCKPMDNEDIKMTVRYNIEPLIKEYFRNDDTTANKLIQTLEDTIS